jgi:hypothetical protein
MRCISPNQRSLKGWEMNENTVEKPQKHIIGTSNYMIKSPKGHIDKNGFA